MSLEIVKSQVMKFLKSDAPEVIAIKGKWGVGKTHAWKQYIFEASNEEKIALKRYSYVSLFGVNSLEQFKYSIFENIVNRDLIGKGANIETFRNNILGLSEKFGRRVYNVIRGVPGVKELSSTIDSLSFLSIKETIICVDDLERKGDNLNIKDVLGLVSMLKEERKCKIILIFNDIEDVKTKYEMFQEKVVDKELEFSPTIEENLDIIYQKDGKTNDWLKTNSMKLGIKNLRILIKIQRLVEEVKPMLDEYEEEIMQTAVASIVLFAWSYFASRSDDNIPNLEYILNYKSLIFNLNESEEKNDKEKRWESTLENYRYTHTDELDEAIARAVKCGYFVEREIKNIAKKKNEIVIKGKSQNSFNKAWNLYHESFEDNRVELIEGLSESYKKNVKYISIADLNNTVSLFKELGENKKASEIIDFFIENWKDENEMFNLKVHSQSIYVKDDEIRKKFEKQYKKYSKQENAKEVLERLIKQPSCGQNDEIVLANTTIDQYYLLFKSIDKNPNVTYYISKCLEFANLSNSTETHRKISNNAKEALIRIGGESKINKLRVKQLGISIE